VYLILYVDVCLGGVGVGLVLVGLWLGVGVV